MGLCTGILGRHCFKQWLRRSVTCTVLLAMRDISLRSDHTEYNSSSESRASLLCTIILKERNGRESCVEGDGGEWRGMAGNGGHGHLPGCLLSHTNVIFSRKL